MEERTERLLRAIGSVGGDLIDTAEKRVFPRSPWQKVLPVAACLLLVSGLALLCMPAFHETQQETQPIAELTQTTVQVGETGEKAPQNGEKNAAQDLRVLARERISFCDTVYYVEALSDRADDLGEYLGTNASGEPVYARMGSTLRPIHQELDLPSEIYVETQVGYLLCRTFYGSALPVCTAEEAARLCASDELEILAQMLAAPMESSGSFSAAFPEFQDPDVLTSDRLFEFFQRTLLLELSQGSRSEEEYRYLWYDAERAGYVIPVADVQAQLERYLGEVSFDAQHCSAYNRTLHALVTETLPEVREQSVRLEVLPQSGYRQDRQTLVMIVACYAAETDETAVSTRTYTISFTENGCVYESIHTIS